MKENNCNCIHVIFRACDAITSVHNTTRPFGLDKLSTVKACFKSLINSLEGTTYTITIIGDKLSDELTHFFEGFPVKVIHGSFGNEASLKKSIEIALTLPKNDYVYFCEDDYLHRKETFAFVQDLLNKKKEYIAPTTKFKLFQSGNRQLSDADLVIFPTDYPDRYISDKRKQSFIICSKYCHWRQVTSTTFTFIAPLNFIHKHKEVFLRASKTADDGYLSRRIFGKTNFFNKALCLSPIPSLTCHLHTTSISPLIFWEAIIDEVLKTSKF